MEFIKVKGKKENDWILSVKSDGWEWIKMKDILYIIKHICDNEGRLYPKGRIWHAWNTLYEEIKKL